MQCTEQLKMDHWQTIIGHQVGQRMLRMKVTIWFTYYQAPPLWRNSRGRRQFRVTIGRLVLGSIPGCDLRERNFGGVQNHTKECTGVSEMITLHQYNRGLAWFPWPETIVILSISSLHVNKQLNHLHTDSAELWL